MVTERLEVRLDPDQRRKLAELAETRRAPVAAVVRELIDAAYDAARRDRLRRGLEVIANANVEDVPDPDELSRQLDETHDLGDLR